MPKDIPGYRPYIPPVPPVQPTQNWRYRFQSNSASAAPNQFPGIGYQFPGQGQTRINQQPGPQRYSSMKQELRADPAFLRWSQNQRQQTPPNNPATLGIFAPVPWVRNLPPEIRNDPQFQSWYNSYWVNYQLKTLLPPPPAEISQNGFKGLPKGVSSDTAWAAKQLLNLLFSPEGSKLMAPFLLP
jgi:hypothetical protein